MTELIKSMSTITLTILVMIVIIVLTAFLLLYPIVFGSIIGVAVLTEVSYLTAITIKNGIRLREEEHK